MIAGVEFREYCLEQYEVLDRKQPLASLLRLSLDRSSSTNSVAEYHVHRRFDAECPAVWKPFTYNRCCSACSFGFLTNLQWAALLIAFFTATSIRAEDDASSTLAGKSDNVHLKLQERLVADEVHEAFLSTADSVQFLNIRIKPIRAGEKRAVELLLHNKVPTRSSVRFLEVRPHCKCTSTQVPAVELPADKSERLGFLFNVDKHPTSPRQIYPVTIKASGALNVIELRFEAELEKYIGFIDREVLHRFSSKSQSSELRLLLNVSGDVELDSLVKNINAQVSRELNCVQATIDVAGDRPAVRCSIDVAKFTPNGGRVSGVIELRQNDEVLDQIHLTLESGPELEAIPSKLIFRSSDKNKSLGIANLLLKYDAASNTDLNSISSIDWTGPFGETVDTQRERVGTGMWRVTVIAPWKVGAGRSEVQTSIRITTESGSTYSLELEFLVPTLRGTLCCFRRIGNEWNGSEHFC